MSVFDEDIDNHKVGRFLRHSVYIQNRHPGWECRFKLDFRFFFLFSSFSPLCSFFFRFFRSVFSYASALNSTECETAVWWYILNLEWTHFMVQNTNKPAFVENDETERRTYCLAFALKSLSPSLEFKRVLSSVLPPPRLLMTPNNAKQWRLGKRGRGKLGTCLDLFLP